MIDLKVFEFAEAKQPKFQEKKGSDGGYIKYGENNDYPEYLVNLYNKSPKHGAIIKSKVHYITGNGWIGGDDATKFIEKANRVESLDDITRKICLDIELFGGAYIEVIWNGFGQIAELWHVDYTNIRTNKDNTQYWYKKDWKDNKEKQETLQAFNPNIKDKKKQILYVKEYRPNIGIYALPSYFAALNYIEADIEVSKHVLGNAQTGFSASKLITLPNGEPSDEEKRKVDNSIRTMYSGSDGKKFMVSFVNDASRKPIIDDLGASDITKEDFAKVDSLIQTNIFSGHQITTPSIMGIAEAGKLGSRTEMRDGYEIFKNTYINAKQRHIEAVINMLAAYKGVTSELKLAPVEAIGIEFSEATIVGIAPKEWILEKLGIDLSKYQTTSTELPQEALSVNEHIKGLKGREWQNMQRIIREFNKGKITREQAMGMLKSGYALSDEEIATWLGSEELEFSEQDFQVFYEFGEAKDKFSIWKTSKRFSDDSDLQLFAEVSQLESDILDQIAKQKDITPNVLAEVLKTDLNVILAAIKSLEDRKILIAKSNIIGKGINSNIVTERTLAKPLGIVVGEVKPTTTEMLIRYSYEWKAGFNDSDLVTSRPFCVHLVKADKLYSRSEIETMSARLGYSVWDRGGGWYGSSPSCRHEWKTNVVTRKK
jgi:hypothetical protein